MEGYNIVKANIDSNDPGLGSFNDVIHSLAAFDRSKVRELFDVIRQSDDGQQHFGAHLVPQQRRALREAGFLGRAAVVRLAKPTGGSSPPAWLSHACTSAAAQGIPVVINYKDRYPEAWAILVNGRTTDTTIVQSADSAAAQCSAATMPHTIRFEQLEKGRLGQNTADDLADQIVAYSQLYVFLSNRFVCTSLGEDIRVLRARPGF